MQTTSDGTQVFTINEIQEIERQVIPLLPNGTIRTALETMAYMIRNAASLEYQRFKKEIIELNEELAEFREQVKELEEDNERLSNAPAQSPTVQ